jgi:hypothetical protein
MVCSMVVAEKLRMTREKIASQKNRENSSEMA